MGRVQSWMMWVAGMLAILYARHPAEARVVSRFEIVTPPSADPISFALSEDGRQLAFVANTESGARLWVRKFDDANAKSLQGTEGARAFFIKS